MQAAEALRAEAQLKRAMLERDHMRRLEAVRDSNRRKTLRDAVAWLRQAARNPHEANMHRWVPMSIEHCMAYSCAAVRQQAIMST